jgi:hypothetical protein
VEANQADNEIEEEQLLNFVVNSLDEELATVAFPVLKTGAKPVVTT